MNTSMLVPPRPDGAEVELRLGANIVALPEFDALPDALEGPVLLTVGDDVSTDDIMPAGSRILALRSNIPEIAKFTFTYVDTTLYDRAMALGVKTGWIVVGGRNYGQGSSRESAALAPRYLGLRAVLAESFARIHAQNLVNFGIVPLVFVNPEDRIDILQGDLFALPKIREEIAAGRSVTVENRTQGRSHTMRHQLSAREARIVLVGGLLNALASNGKPA